MWTPKRILLLVVGLCVFVGAFLFYSRVLRLGDVDGLPPLPQAYLPDPTDAQRDIPPPPDNNAVNRRLQAAFGGSCPEVDWPYKVEVVKRGMVLAAREFEILKDGRVRLAPLHIALVGKPTEADKTPEINTVRSDTALLEFDRPIANFFEMGKRKMVGGQLTGNVELINNNRTERRDDDLSVFSPGPVFFSDAERVIWTKSVVRLKDLKSKPEPTTIDGTGMKLYLASDGTTPRADASKSRKPKSEGISGVERVTL